MDIEKDLFHNCIFIPPAGFPELQFSVLFAHLCTSCSNTHTLSLSLGRGGRFFDPTPPRSGPHHSPFSWPADAIHMNVGPKLSIRARSRGGGGGGGEKELVGPETIFLPSLPTAGLCLTQTLAQIEWTQSQCLSDGGSEPRDLLSAPN